MKRMKRTSVWMFGNNKGGVGKSTLSLNVAAALSEAGKTCTFIDIDESTNSTFHLRDSSAGIQKSYAVSRLFTDPYVALDDCIIWHTKLPGVSLIKSERGMRDYIAQYLDPRDKKAVAEMGSRFADRIQELDGVVDVVIIDVGPTMDAALNIALEAVTHYVFVADASAYAEQGILNLVDSVPRLKPGTENGIDLVGAVYSNINMNSNFAKDIVKRETIASNVPMIPVYIPHRVEIPENQTKGEFAVRPDRESILADSFRDVMKFMLERTEDYQGAFSEDEA